ncbi:MAG: glycosyltransferase family 2 protein [Octadecabacter sp.]
MAKHQYTILSMMKDEGHSLVEWVAYHKHIGFDNICVYTNNCNDGTDDMLIRLEQLGWVQHFRNDVPEGKKPQPNALALAANNDEITDSDWVLTMDADEFVSIKCGDGMITDVMDRLPPQTDALAITWRFFGSSEVTPWNPGLVTETYTKAAPDRFRKGWGVKSMFKPREHIKFGIHRPTNKPGKMEQLGEDADILTHWVNGSGQPMPESFQQKGWRSTGRTLGYGLIELNHYAVKSYEAYLLRRLRGNVNNKEDKYNASYFAIFDRNEEEHLNVQRHSKALHAKIAEILEDPVMRDLHNKALEFHASRVERLRSLGEYDPWLVELKKASAVEITGLDEVLFTQHLPKIWQEKIKEMQAKGVPDGKIAKMVASSVGIKAAEDERTAEVFDAARPTQRGDNRPPPRDKPKDKSPKLNAKINPETAPNKYRTTILSMMKDEGHSLVEWVAYHKHIGFENICVYTNNCNDGTDKMLMRLQELGHVQHFRNDVPEGKRPQMNALSLAGRNPEVMHSEWVLVMDADEFLTVKTGDGKINDLLDAMDPDAQAMAITWRFFGSSGVTDWNPGLVTESYSYAADDGFRKGWGVKTLFKPYADIKLGIHRPSIRKLNHRPENAKALLDQLWLNGSGDPLPDEFSLSGWRSTRPTIGYALAEMNHYAVKSYEAYLLRRVRGNVNNKEDKYNAAYFAYFDRNETQPGAIDRHIPAVRSLVDDILSDPKMRELQDEALAYHAGRVKMLRDSGEYDHWLRELKDASSIDVDALKESVIFTQHLPKSAQAEVARLKQAGVADDDIRDFITSLRTASKGKSRSNLIAQAKGETAGEATQDNDDDTDARTSRAEARASADTLIAALKKKSRVNPARGLNLEEAKK